MTTTIVTKGWTKLDSGIINSTLWMRDDATLRVWIALLASCDAGGYARVAIPAMAYLCRMEIAEFERVIKDLCKPDPYSRCQDNDGRRVQPVEGGFVVLSYVRYREMKTRAQTPAERKQAQREREKVEELLTKSHTGHECHDVTTDTEAEADTEAEKKQPVEPSGPTPLERVWEGHIEARHAYFRWKNGKPPARKLALTTKRKTLIRRAIKEHGEQAALDAGRGVFFSEFNIGKNDRETEYISPEVCWRMNATTDNVCKFAELAAEKRQEREVAL